MHHLICRQTDFQAEAVDAEAGIQGLYAALAGDEARNELILNDIIAAVDEGRSPIVLDGAQGPPGVPGEPLREASRVTSSCCRVGSEPGSVVQLSTVLR